MRSSSVKPPWRGRPRGWRRRQEGSEDCAESVTLERAPGVGLGVATLEGRPVPRAQRRRGRRHPPVRQGRLRPSQRHRAPAGLVWQPRPPPTCAHPRPPDLIRSSAAGKSASSRRDRCRQSSTRLPSLAAAVELLNPAHRGEVNCGRRRGRRPRCQLPADPVDGNNGVGASVRERAEGMTTTNRTDATKHAPGPRPA
jgi:hypothetical protein